jgi:hypothetical protein
MAGWVFTVQKTLLSCIHIRIRLREKKAEMPEHDKHDINVWGNRDPETNEMWGTGSCRESR